MANSQSKDPVRVADASVEELAAHILRRTNLHDTSAVHEELIKRLTASGHMSQGGHGFAGVPMRDLII